MEVQIALALIDADVPENQSESTRSALIHLAQDFEEALGVYERVYAPNKASVRSFKVRQFMLSAQDLEVAKASNQQLGHTSSSFELEPNVALYAIACTSETQCSPAAQVLEQFEQLCSVLELYYCGGLAVCGSRQIASHAQAPRMGFLRRRTSEALDQLIAAVRSNCSVCDLMTLAASPNPSNIICTSPNRFKGWQGQGRPDAGYNG